MFYAHIVLAKKGPLARIWLAAHWDKKLTKAHVFETNIEQSVEGIMQPKVKLALRTSGHLLLGVVRIYSRKAKYLLADCNEAFVKIKMAFRPGMVDLPEGHREAAVNAITLPEVFHDFDTALPELNDVDIEAQFAINQTRAEEITMREDYGSMTLSIHEEGFGDIGFEAETPDLVREARIDENLFAEDLEREEPKEPVPGTSRAMLSDDLGPPLVEEGFGEEFGQPAAGLFEGDIFGEAPLPASEAVAGAPSEASDDDIGAPSPAPSFAESRPPTPLEEPPIGAIAAGTEGINVPERIEEEEKPTETQPEQITLLRDEEESFALAPVDATAYRGVTKAKRKRKLIVDEVKNISGEEMKSQLANTSDIVTTLDLAPPTKRLMYWKETGGVEKLFALPSRDIPARCLFPNYQRHLLSRNLGVEDFSVLGPSDVLALDHIQEQEVPANAAKKTRKRKLPVAEVPEPEPIREAEPSRVSAISVDMGSQRVDESIMPPPEAPSFEPLLLPPPGVAINAGMDITGIEGIESIPELPADQVSSILTEEETREPGRMDHLLHEGLAADWRDEFEEFPAMVYQPEDEQMEDETVEQFEERVLNKRAAQLFVAIRNRMQRKEDATLSELTYKNRRKQAAQKFYSLLVLKKFCALEITQEEPYGEITITKGPMFDNPKL